EKMVCKEGERKIAARCYPPESCPPGKSEQDGLCYQDCPGGMKGVGPVCWSTPEPGSGWVDCGAGLAESKNVCAKHVGEQAGSTSWMVLQGGAATVTAGGSEAASAAVKAAKNADKLASLKQKLKLMKEAQQAVKAAKAAKKAKKAAEAAKRAEE